jgi:hypothetical protein
MARDLHSMTLAATLIRRGFEYCSVTGVPIEMFFCEEIGTTLSMGSAGHQSLFALNLHASGGS